MRKAMAAVIAMADGIMGTQGRHKLCDFRLPVVTKEEIEAAIGMANDINRNPNDAHSDDEHVDKPVAVSAPDPFVHDPNTEVAESDYPDMGSRRGPSLSGSSGSSRSRSRSGGFDVDPDFGLGIGSYLGPRPEDVGPTLLVGSPRRRAVVTANREMGHSFFPTRTI